MAKLTLSDVSNLSGNPTSAQSTINTNSAAIETALENTLSRDGTSPNTMGDVLDMNSNRIINLPEPSNGTEPLRLTDLADFIGGSLTINGIAGPASSTDNAVVRWNGTAGSAVQNSGVIVGDDNTVTALALSVTSPSGLLSTLPVGNALTTMSSINVQGSRQSSTVREFMANFGMTSTIGFTAVAPNKDGVTLYSGIDAQTGSGDVWALNTVTNMAANLSNDINVHGYECDFNNVYKAYTSLSPIATGISISGAGTFLSSCALLITGTISSLGVNPIWTMGIVLAGPSIRDYSIYDATNSVIAHLVQGTHTTGIDLSGATISGNAFVSPSFNVTGAGALVAASIRSPSPSGGIGYSTGAGGAVTQATSKSTGVTLNTLSGAITMNAAALAANTTVSFVLTDTSIAITDVLILNHISGGTVGGYTLNAQAAAGSATINVRNNTAGGLSEAVVIQFAVIKGVNA